VPLVELGGGRAVKADKADVWMGVKKGAKVVRDRIIRDVRIETPGTGRGRQDIPERDAQLDEHPDAPGIVGR